MFRGFKSFLFLLCLFPGALSFGDDSSPLLRYDNFNSFDAKVWNRSQCDYTYPLNQITAVRKSSCEYLKDAQETFLRVTWLPWEKRGPVDLIAPHGGAELSTSDQNLYEPTTGTLYYSIRFRIVDLSALEGKLAKDAIIWQWHTSTPIPDGADPKWNISPLVSLRVRNSPYPDQDRVVVSAKTRHMPFLDPYSFNEDRKNEPHRAFCVTDSCDFDFFVVDIPKSRRSEWHTATLQITWANTPPTLKDPTGLSRTPRGALAFFFDQAPQVVKLARLAHPGKGLGTRYEFANGSIDHLRVIPLETLPFVQRPYMKVGIYAVGWPSDWKSLHVDTQKKISIDFTQLKVGNNLSDVSP